MTFPPHRTLESLVSPLRLFRKKPTEKKKEAQATQHAEPETLLNELCGSNTELYEALSRTLLLNPEMTVRDGIDPHIQKAKEFEENQKLTNARIEYQLAGQIALYEGKLPQVQKLFKKATETEPDTPCKKAFEYFSKKENAERAIVVAREFYEKTAKHV